MQAKEILLPNGSQLYVEQSGNGQELILFLHAVGGDHSSWQKQVEAFEARYVCVTYDMRGHNKSPIPSDIKAQIHIEGFAEDAALLIRQLGFRRTHLVGLSMGGAVALQIFQSYPQLVQSLTLANTWAFYPDSAARNQYISDILAHTSMSENAVAAGGFLLAPNTPTEIVGKVAQVEGAKNKEVFLQSWHKMFVTDHRKLLPRIDVPTLIIGGPHDKIIPTDPILTLMRDKIPMAQLVEIEGAGHFSNLDHPAEFNKALAGLLSRAKATGDQRLQPQTNSHMTLEADTVAHALIQLLQKRGIEYFFSNSGTDFTPIIDAFARYEGQADFNLKTILAPHENTAIAMAHGYFLLSQRPQAVMAHVNVGTANMGLGLINAARSRIPMLVLAGRTPWYEDTIEGCRTNFVQWGQDTYDQAAYFREFTRWDYELKGSHNLESTLDRALAIAQSDPAGPVYLTLPKEVLCQAVDKNSRYNTAPRLLPNSPAEANADMLEAAAQMILAANNPLVVTAELGRYMGGPEALVQLSNRYALGVIEHGKHNFFNFPTDNPHHQGFVPSPHVEAADLILVIESHVPYIPALAKMKEPPVMIGIGVDPIYKDLPMRSFPSDLSLAGNPALILRRLVETLDRLSQNNDTTYQTKITARSSQLATTHNHIWQQASEKAAADSSHPAITKQYLSYCIGQAVDENTIIFNEYDLEPQLVPRRITGSWFENSIASGLGWSLGAALGGQLARPDQTIMVTLGDGAYLFNTPLSAHYVASAYKLPILIVVFNDKGWTTIKKSYLGTTPNGWAQRTGNFPLTGFSPDFEMQYDKLAEACGGIGLRVDKPSELPQMLQQALETVRKERRHVLLNVICEPDA